MALDLAPSADAELIASAVTEVLTKEGGLALRRDPDVIAAGVSTALWRTVSELGYGALTAPQHVGGADLPVSVAAHAHQTYGRFLAPLPLLGCGLLAPELLAISAPELAREITSGALVATLDPAELLAAAPAVTVDGDRATGRLAQVPYGVVADLLVARTGDGVCAVRLDGPGVNRRARPDLTNQGFAAITLTGAPVVARGPAPSARLIATARVLRAAEAVGAARAALELAVAYAGQRHQFGVPIGSFQAIQHRLADVVTAGHAADLAVSRAAWALDARPAGPDGQLDPAVAGAVVVAWRTATQALSSAGRAGVQTLGGYGFTLEFDAHLFYRYAKAVEVTFGPDRGFTAAEIDAVRERGDDTFL